MNERAINLERAMNIAQRSVDQNVWTTDTAFAFVRAIGRNSSEASDVLEFFEQAQNLEDEANRAEEWLSHWIDGQDKS